MTEHTLGELLNKLASLGPVFAVLVGIIITGYRQNWVFGWQFREVKQDRDFWRDAALKAANIAERRQDQPVR